MNTVALVTGANRGLGLEVARHLGLAGAATIIAARDRDAGARAAATLRDEGIDASAVVLDVTSNATVRHAVDVVERSHGRLDVLVNNAGILPEAFGVVVPAYQASKAALNGVTVALSKQLADTSIVVSSVCPGWVQTDLAPGNREDAPLTASDAAQTVVDVALRRDATLPGAFVDRDGLVPW